MIFFVLHSLRVPSAPSASLFTSMIPDAVVIAIVIFATNVSLAKVFAKRNNYVVDSNQVTMQKWLACNFSIIFSILCPTDR